MGYDIHITRKTHWFDDEGPTISMEEWKAYIASDPELRLDGYAETTVGNGAVLRVKNEGMAVWTAYSKDNTAWIWLDSSGIVAKNPDNEILRKMFQIAQMLGARVVGDDDEEYDADGEMVATDDFSQHDIPPDSQAPKRPWWKWF
ncbi:hypothetical protein [Luteibacter sp. CQ10]|uniref:hypothetical protein n=1 Tax=Luteibacter sp. CQ10 TaxID=2805821 RepID=UPI0034A244D9